MIDTRTGPAFIDPELLATAFEWSNTLEVLLNDGAHPTADTQMDWSPSSSTLTTAQMDDYTNGSVSLDTPIVDTLANTPHMLLGACVQTGPAQTHHEYATLANLKQLNLFQRVRRINQLKKSNENRPINRLPSELLRYIFHLCAFSERELQKSRRWARQRLDTAWIAEITHTCHHWRNVALDDPGLWACIPDFHDQQLTNVMVSRSKSSPLTIHLFITYEIWEPVALRFLLERLAALRGRIRSLIFGGFPIPKSLCTTLFSEKRVTHSVLPTHPIVPSYPHINEIQNDITSSAVGLPGLQSITATTYSPSVFHVDSARNLRFLYLTGYNLPWNTQNLTRLTELSRLHIEIHEGYSSNGQIRTPITTLINLLPLLSRLTHLHLSMVFERVSQEAQAWANQRLMRVTLPHLQDLALFDSFLPCLVFLDRVCFPSSARVRISHKGSMEPSEIHHLESILQWVNHRVESPTSLRTWQLRVSEGYPESLTFSVAPCHQTSSAQTQGNSFINEGESLPDFCLEGQFRQADFRTVIPLFESQQFEVAVLDVRSVDVRTWILLAHAKSLHTIVLRRTEFGFLNKHSGGTWDPEDIFLCTNIAEDASIFFPSLQTIIAEECDFPLCYFTSFGRPCEYARHPAEEYASDLPTRIGDPTFDRHRLLEFFEIRKETGYEFNALRLVDCGGLTEEVLHSFSEVVNTIVISRTDT